MIPATAALSNFDACLAAIVPIRDTSPRPSKTASDESALISCILLTPWILKELPLRGVDFAEFGHGEAYACLNFQYRQTGEIHVDALYQQLSEQLPDNPTDLILDWLNFVPHWHWRYLAKKVATASFLRHEAAMAVETISDINDRGMSFAEFDQRNNSREQERRELRNRLNGLLR